jgi:serine phosphatase RsbU (regulator of sigma subunit)/Tfp pilus assembly protein PilF
MKQLLFLIFSITLHNIFGQNIDSLTSVFNDTKGDDKLEAAYELYNYWYNAKDDSVLYYLDFVLNQEEIEEDDTIVALAYKLRGNLYFFERQYHKAELQYIKGLEFYKNASHAVGTENTLNNLGLVLLRQNKFDEAISFLDLSIQEAEKSKDLLAMAKTLHNKAYVYELKSEIETALEFYLKALKVKRNFNDSASVSSTLNNIGNIYFDNLEYDKALKYYNQSLNISKHLKDSSDIALRLYNIARVHKRMYKFELSLQSLQKSLDIYKQLGDTSQMARIYNSLGSLSDDWNKHDEAILYFQKSLQILDKEKDKIEIARLYNNLAQMYEIQKQYKKALQFFSDAKDIIIKTELNKDKIAILNNYGMLLAKLKKFDDAKKIFAQTIKISRESQNSQLLILSLIDYSRLFYFQKKYSTAISILLEAQERLWKIDDFNLNRQVYSHLYNNYRAMKKYKQALQYYEFTNQMKDSIFTQESLKAITELEKKYKLSEKEKEITLLTQQNRLQELENTAQKATIRNVTLTKNFAIGGGALLLLLVIISFYAFLLKRRANNKLKLYNAEIIEQKEEILAQRDEIETQLKHIEQQNELLQTQKTHITDSITYAQYIQKSIYPRNDFLKNNFEDYFVFHQPKDIVSGDFYFGEETSDYLFVGVIDCTGHGVPGAFMSMLSYNALRTTVLEKNINDPAKILYHLDFLIKEYTHSSPEIAGNGMDMVLAVINKESGKMEISGAKRPLLIARKGELHEIQGTKRSIGRIKHREQKNFEKVEWQLQKNDILYMFSDGYADQFGGDKTQKFKSSQLKNKLYEIQNMQLSIQKNILIRTFEDWKGQNEQIDDILVLGIKI